MGFLAFTLPQVAILMPTKKPRSEALTLEQHVANQALHQRRLRIEHVNALLRRQSRARGGVLLVVDAEHATSGL